MKFIIIIPARYASTRLPGKPLINIHGKSIIRHVLDRARESGANRIIVGTDHKDVADEVISEKCEVCMTRSNNQSGIERLAEVVEKYNFKDETIIVNVQCDEPMIQGKIIRQIAENLEKNQVAIETIAVPIYKKEEAFNPNVVKVVTDIKGYAIYFSRATIPWDRNRFNQESKEIINNIFFRHLGIYCYRVSFIRRYISWKPSPIEKIEMLEQLRALWYGEKIHVSIVQRASGISIDTKEDLVRMYQEK